MFNEDIIGGGHVVDHPGKFRSMRVIDTLAIILDGKCRDEDGFDCACCGPPSSADGRIIVYVVLQRAACLIHQ